MVLDGRVALVTGGTRGIGARSPSTSLAMARRLRQDIAGAKRALVVSKTR